MPPSRAGRTSSAQDEVAGNGRLARWLYSNRNLVGCGLALAAPVLAVTGLVAPPVALALVPVLYAAGALAAPGPRTVDLVAGMDSRDVTRSLRTIRSRIEGRVGNAVKARVDNICALIESLLPRAGEFGAASEELYVLVRTATDYLPRTLEPYLALPRMYADHKAISGGKTPTQILCGQLDVMFERLVEIEDALARSDSDKLLANGRFLSERFGERGLALPEGPPGTGADDGPPGASRGSAT